VFGCCGFLSFSLVFCKFGGRFETTLYIHFIRNWVKSRRHSSALRRNEDEKKGGKERHSSQCRTLGSALLWGFGVVGGECRGGGWVLAATAGSALLRWALLNGVVALPRRRPVVDVAEIRNLAWGLLRLRFYAGGSAWF
jgi:hypothetical protein